MAKKDEAAAAGEEPKAAKVKKAKKQRPPLVDRVTRLVLVLFLASLAVPHLVPA